MYGVERGSPNGNLRSVRPVRMSPVCALCCRMHHTRIQVLDLQSDLKLWIPLCSG
jgi:hypothetical protein